MIIRIATEGQYEVRDGDLGALNQLDNDAVAAVEAADEERFRATFNKMLELIRSEGRRLADDELEGSDVILPPPDLTLDEAREEFSGEGLIPG